MKINNAKLIFNKHELVSLERTQSIVIMAREKIKHIDEPLNCLLGNIQWDITRILEAHGQKEGLPLRGDPAIGEEE